MPESDEKQKGIDGHLFRLIATFEAAAMQQLGKIANPITGDVEVSLEGARDAVEMLDMVKRKTAGNLNGDESRFLDHVLYQLRMNYVDVAGDTASAEKESGAGTGGGDSEDAERGSAGTGAGSDGKAGSDSGRSTDEKTASGSSGSETDEKAGSHSGGDGRRDGGE